MKTNKYNFIVALLLLLSIASCKTPSLAKKNANTKVPEQYTTVQDTVNSGKISWKTYFKDVNLQALIDQALKNNQELNITLQEIEISKNEIKARKGEYLPFVGAKAGAAVDKKARFTNLGAMEATTEIKPGEGMPEPLKDFNVGLYANWELDVWKKLRNAKKSAVNRYLSSIEGKNFMVTNLVAEIANSYYELLALDNQLEILNQNITLQSNALEIVKWQKDAARTTELAVKKFEAEVLKTYSLRYDLQQKIVETENRINFLAGRFPQPVKRDSGSFTESIPNAVHTGLPSDLLANRPDIKQAEFELAATKLDVKSARARFYPSLGISAGIGYQAFNPEYIFKPESLLYSLAGDLVAPLINRNAIKASYNTANAKQIQAAYNYEQTILKAYIEVSNQVSKISNLEKSYALRNQQVEALNSSVNISNDLFRSARADYMEVLLTQRDALESKFDLVETKMRQLNTMVNIYRALGGGWQ